jgi:1-acyl-sn-glycerol-3-phosphate acyltransferase
MSIDGFELSDSAPFVGFDPAFADAFWRRVDRASELLHVKVENIERIPPGPTLLVMNHAFGWDAMIPMAGIRKATGRRVWALGEHLWWSLPFLRTVAAKVGTVDGTPANVDELLGRGDIVLVLPGGLREALKPSTLRYRLLWGDRYGFVRAAMRNKAMIVPVASIGADEIFDFVGDAFARGRRWLRRDFPLPRPSFGIPWPHRQRLEYYVGEPISAEAHPGESIDSATRRLRRETRGALEELIDEALAQRAGVGH